MSNSERAKRRRLKRKHMTKHQRSIMASQHFGDKHLLERRTVRPEPVSLDVIKEERRRRRSLWHKVKDFCNQRLRVRLQRKQQ